VGTVPTPGTITSGTAFTQAQGNSWRDSNNWCLSNHPMGVFRNSAVQSVNTSSSTAITLDTEDIDSDAGHSGSGSKYTAATAGWYLITAYISFAADATGLRQLEIRVNSAGITLESQPTVGAGAATHLSTSTHYFLNGTTDFVEMFAFHTKGSALNVASQCRLTVEWRRNL
jgi:hypothetical protein